MNQPTREPAPKGTSMGQEPGPVKDAVCGKTVHTQTTPWSIRHGDVTYYFCSLSCALQFKAAPEAYLAH